MTEPLNLCRQYVQWMLDVAPRFKRFIDQAGVKEYVAMSAHCFQQISMSQKFILPVGGRLLDDPELRGIDEDEDMRLPFKYVVLEYLRNKAKDPPTDEKPYTCSKTIILAREVDPPAGPVPLGMTAVRIGIIPINWIVELGVWSVQPEFGLCGIGRIVNGRRTFLGGPSQIGEKFPASDYEDELGAVMSFISAISCSNVATQSVLNRALTAKQIRGGTLPFDEYKVLTIGDEKSSNRSPLHHTGQHASPREHLRRGHIRRLEGRRIWVNSCVVNPGAAGKITKDYALAAHCA